MFWLIGGASFVRAACKAWPHPVTNLIEQQLNHSDWVGLRFYDLIFPSFVFMVGLSIPFSFAKRRRTEDWNHWLAHALQRTVVLFLLGSLRTSITSGSPRVFELSSALQPIALGYLVASLLAAAKVRTQIIIAAAILILYALLLALVPPDALGPYAIHRNLVTVIDRAVLGESHRDGWGTLLCSLPTISTAILGLLMGQLLMSERSPVQKARLLGLVAAGCILAGLALSPLVPVIMKLWTASYGLVSSGLVCLLLLFFYWIVDMRGSRGWTLVFIVIGSNAIAAYLGPTIVPTGRIVGIFTKVPEALLGLPGRALHTALVLTLNWFILHWMYKRKIFIKA